MLTNNWIMKQGFKNKILMSSNIFDPVNNVISSDLPTSVYNNQ